MKRHIYHFDCPAVSSVGDFWRFTWDSEAGTVSGPAADAVREVASTRGCALHLYPDWHEFSAEPLKSLRDMAAIVGWAHRLPRELGPHYPPSSGPTPDIGVN